MCTVLWSSVGYGTALSCTTFPVLNYPSPQLSRPRPPPLAQFQPLLVTSFLFHQILMLFLRFCHDTLRCGVPRYVIACHVDVFQKSKVSTSSQCNLTQKTSQIFANDHVSHRSCTCVFSFMVVLITYKCACACTNIGHETRVSAMRPRTEL